MRKGGMREGGMREGGMREGGMREARMREGRMAVTNGQCRTRALSRPLTDATAGATL